MNAILAVPLTDQELLAEFEEALSRAAPVRLSHDRVFHLEFKGFDGRLRLDARLQLEGGDDAVIAIELMRTGYPRDMRNAVWVLQEYARTLGPGAEVIQAVVAERLSPGARELLRGRGIAFYDRSGSLFFKRGNLIVDIERQSKSPDRGRAGSEFYGSREKVVHALLARGSRPFTGTELAQEAGTSIYTVSQALSILEAQGMVTGKGAGRTAQRRLTDAGALLDEWAKAWTVRPEDTSTWFFLARDPSQLETSLASKLLRQNTAWAYTGVAAGNYIAPLLTGVDRVDVIVPRGRAQQVAQAVNLQPAATGFNVTLTERDGASDMYRRSIPDYYDISLASSFIVYLDLVKDDRGRNKELSRHLRETVLKI